MTLNGFLWCRNHVGYHDGREVPSTNERCGALRHETATREGSRRPCVAVHPATAQATGLPQAKPQAVAPGQVRAAAPATNGKAAASDGTSLVTQNGESDDVVAYACDVVRRDGATDEGTWGRVAGRTPSIATRSATSPRRPAKAPVLLCEIGVTLRRSARCKAPDGIFE